MFDLGWSELGIVILLAVVVLGPRELPRAMRTVGQWTRRLRLLVADFQSHLEGMADDADMADLQKKAKKLSSANLSHELTQMVDPDGVLARDLSATEFGTAVGGSSEGGTVANTPLQDGDTDEGKTPSSVP